MLAFIKDFQTLIAALIGLTAAFATLFAVWLTQRLTGRREADAFDTKQRQVAQFFASLMAAESLTTPQALRAASRWDYKKWFDEGRLSGPVEGGAFAAGIQMFYEDVKVLPRPVIEGLSLVLWVTSRLNSALKDLQETKSRGNTPEESDLERLQTLVWMAILVGEDTHQQLMTFANGGIAGPLPDSPGGYWGRAHEHARGVNRDYSFVNTNKSQSDSLLAARFKQDEDYRGTLVDIADQAPNHTKDTGDVELQ